MYRIYFLLTFLGLSQCLSIDSSRITIEEDDEAELAKMFEELESLPHESLEYFENTNPEISYDGTPLIEADIRMTPDEFNRQAGPRVWPNTNINYTISEESKDDVKHIEAALKQWEEETCLKFTKVKGNFKGKHLLFIKKGSECSSPIGPAKTSLTNNVSIGEKCTKKGIIMHEVAHSMGLAHEHSRPDRDAYIELQLENMLDGKEDQFAINKATKNYSVPYDLSSVMQYGAFYFTKNKKRTIQPHVFYYLGLLGQREGTTHRDRRIMNKMYDCSKHCDETAPKCQNEGYLDKNCKCACPPRITGDTCEIVPEDYSYYEICGNDNITTEGDITSHNYPEIYPYGEYCFWVINAPPGKKVQVKFNKFKIIHKNPKNGQCQYDYVQIHPNGELEADEKMCGTYAQGKTFVSKSSKMAVAMKSMKNEQRFPKMQKGFHATVKFI